MESLDPLEQMLADEDYDNPRAAAEKIWAQKGLGTPAEELKRDNPGEGGSGVREPRQPKPDTPSGTDQLPIPSDLKQ